MAVTFPLRFLTVFRLAVMVVMLAAAPRHAAASTYDVLFGPVLPSQRLASTANTSKWFVEFRARGGSPVGHSYVVLGVRNASGTERIVRVAGFYASMGVVGTTASIIGVPGVIGYKKTALGKASVRYRRSLTRGAFARIERAIIQAAKHPGTFTMLSNNCNAFVARIARMIGLRAPRSTAVHAPTYVKQMIALNRQ